MPAPGQENLKWKTEGNPRSHLWTPKIRTLCQHCGKGIVTTEYRKNRGAGKYCSRACQTAVKIGKPSKKAGGLTATCLECGKEFKTQAARVKAGRGKCCSKECAGKYHVKTHPEFVGKGKKRPDITGANHPAWKGGATPEYQIIRTSAEYLIWRRAILERDFYICTACGSKERLHAHHILKFVDFPHKRFDLTNGITLCLPCHWKVHGKKERNK